MKYNKNWNLIGHDWAVKQLQNNIANERIRHAYLVTGPEGIGRRTLSLRLAQGINCKETSHPGLPCGICRSCRLINEMKHPDLHIVQADEVGGRLKVKQIRDLQQKLTLSPYENHYKIALILRFEEANPSAANALLKTLEEPPSRVVMILTALDAESLLPTIVSRCEMLHLRSLPIKKVTQGLQSHYDIPPQEAELLSHISGGRPGYALRYLNNPELMSQRLKILEELGKLLSSNRVERFAYAEIWVKNKENIKGKLEVWSAFWRDIMLTSSGSSVPVLNFDQENNMNGLSKQINYQEAKEMIKVIDRTQKLLNRNANTRLALEILMLDLPFIRL